MRNIYLCSFFIIFLFFPYTGFSEGTKQVRPTVASYGDLSITNNDPNYPNFAIYGCAPNYRLYIHISNVNETILFGLRRSSMNNRNYQLNDPTGTVVMSGACPNVATDAGYISTYNQAVIGPFPSDGGYTPLVYKVTDPTKLGDYWLEFSSSIQFSYFDFQIVSGAHDPALITDTINGRVFSQSWQFYADLAPVQPFSAHMFVYSDDSITTECQYDGAHVGRFTMFCNSVGCLNTGNFTSDRQSKNTNTYVSFPGIAQYKVFFNNPDLVAYPNGIYGSMTSTPTISYDPAYPICSGRKIITVVVNKAGNVDVKITVPYGSPGTDVYIPWPVTSGTNLIPWDGKDGTGAMVPDGTAVTIVITYVNGLTNLPLWDVEKNPNGFRITLVRPINPQGEIPKTYWDDSETTGCPNPPTINLTGCLPTVVEGCHIWQPTGSDCHDKMINTWWYSASTSTATLNIVQVVTPPPPVVNGPFNRCGTGDVNLIATVLDGEVVRWWDQPTGGTLLGTTNSGDVFTRTLSSIGVYHFYAEAYNPTPPYFCTSSRTDVVANAFAIPDPPSGTSPVTRCGTGEVTITASAGPGDRIDWYDAAFAGNLLGTGNSYTTVSLPAPSTTVFYAEAVTTATSCSSTVRTPFTVIVKEIPDIIVTPASTTLCSGQTTNIFLQSNFPGATISWDAGSCINIVCPVSGSGPPGSFINDILNLTDYLIPGSLNYDIKSTFDGCTSANVSHPVTINAFPPVSLNDFTPVCLNTPEFMLTGGSPSGGTYSGTGVTPSGSFNPNTAGVGTHTITYTYTEAVTGCTNSASKPITVNPIPNVVTSVPSPVTICSGNNAQVALSSNVPGTETITTFAWTASGNGSTITPDPSTISGTGDIMQNLANSGNILEPVVFHIIPTAAGCSPASPTDFTFNVNPVPVVQSSPGIQQVLCSSTATQPIALQTNVTGLSPSYSWTTTCDPALTGCPPASGTSNPIASFTPVNPTTSQKAVTFSIVASLDATSGSCPGPAAGYTVLVNARPNVTNTILSQQVCSGLPSTAVTLTADIAGTTFTWISSATPGITGNTPGGTGDLPVETLFNSTLSQGSVTYTITPSFTQDGVTCAGPTTDYIILVNPLPQPTLNGAVSICEGTTGVVYTTQPGMTSYSWTVSSAGTITAGGTPSSSSVTVTWNTALANQYVEVNYVDLNGCTALLPAHLDVTVNATPVLTVTGTSELCAGSLNVNYSTSAGMSSYAWTISPGGIPVGAVNTNSVNVNWDAGASPSQSVTVSYVNSLGCSNSTVYPVTIQPLPVSAFTGSTTVCQLHPDPYIYTPNSGPVASYTWSITPPSYGTIANPNASPASVTWNTAGQATLRLDAITPFGCTSFSSEPVTINPRPEVSITPCFDLVTNRSAKRFLLKGGRPLLTSTPMQGEYLISPATVALVFDAGNYYFDPTLVAGTQTITFNISYKYTSSQFGCPATSPTSVALIVRGVNPPCGTTMTDYRDIPPSTYRTAFTAGRCWMMENLRYGTSLTPTTTYQTDNCVTEKYCLPSDATCTSYGGLYQWDELIQYGVTAAPDYQGVCPPGWHIPSAADYQALIDANQGNGMAGTILKDLNLNPRGFEALLGGMYYLNTAWAYLSSNVPPGTMFWTSTPGAGNKIITRGMNFPNYSVSYYETSRSNAFTVRCVKD